MRHVVEKKGTWIVEKTRKGDDVFVGHQPKDQMNNKTIRDEVAAGAMAKQGAFAARSMRLEEIPEFWGAKDESEVPTESAIMEDYA